MINHVTIGGNLTDDPELRFLPNGTEVLEATIANNKKWKDANGQTKERVVFVGVTMFGATAKNFAQWHKKGQQCLVEGELTQDKWEDKTTGQKREKTKVRVERWHFVGGRKEGPQAAPAPAPRQAPPAAQPAPADGAPPEDDDVPF